jgi:hypothetical protein
LNLRFFLCFSFSLSSSSLLNRSCLICWWFLASNPSLKTENLTPFW